VDTVPTTSLKESPVRMLGRLRFISDAPLLRHYGRVAPAFVSTAPCARGPKPAGQRVQARPEGSCVPDDGGEPASDALDLSTSPRVLATNLSIPSRACHPPGRHRVSPGRMPPANAPERTRVCNPDELRCRAPLLLQGWDERR